MVIADSDILVYLTYSSSKFKSLGGNITNAAFVQTTDETKYDEYKHNLFNWIKPDDIDNARTTYRCIAIKNSHANESWDNVKAWIVSSAEVQSEITIEILKETPISEVVQQIASEYETPSGTFAAPVTKITGQDCGNIAFGKWIAIWIKRTPTADLESRSFEHLHLRVEGDDGSGNNTYAGIDIHLLWDTITDEIAECLKRLNDIPRDRIDLLGAQKYYNDSDYLVNQITSANVTVDDKKRVAIARTIYLVYQEYTVEVERAGGGLPPMVVSRVYELRRIANEMFNSISKTPTKMKRHIIKSRSYRGRING